MVNFTSNTYQVKRKILGFTNKISKHLDKGTPASAAASYLQQVKKWTPAEPAVYIDGSDVVKPDGHKFESLGTVRDGSESTSTKNVYKKGYHVTEACVLTRSNHPVSIFSKIHSSSEKAYKSVNTITFQSMELGAALFGKVVFCMDCGYDGNKMFLKLDELEQDYVIRLKSNRKLLYHNKWTMASERVTAGRERLKQMSFTKVRAMKHTSPMSKCRSLHLEKPFIWRLFTES